MPSNNLSTRQKKRSRFRGFLLPAICLLLSAYFLHHAINGRFGLDPHSRAEEAAIRLEFRLAEYRRQRDVLSRRVSLLRQGSIEKDMLDEQARYHLNVAHEDEIIIFTSN